MKSAIRVLALLVGLLVSSAAQNWMDSQRRAPAAIEEALYLNSGAALKRASLGFDGLLADLYWIRTIQYFGRKAEEQRAKQDALDVREMVLLEKLLEITTELDPHRVAAYRFGAFFLQYIEPEKAIRFANLGIRNNPDEWRLYQDLGFTYWQEGRFREAGQAYQRGSRIPGSPEWMRTMAATMIARGGDRDLAREMFRRLYHESEDGFIRQVCLEQLRKLDDREFLEQRRDR